MRACAYPAMAPALMLRARTVACRHACAHSNTRMLPCSMRSYRPRTIQRDVTAHFFRFGGKSGDEAGIYGSQGRDDYDTDDVEHYFNYMGMLAVEGTYDRMYEQVKTGIHPADIILMWACQENDAPKVQELLRAGADISVKNLDGKSVFDLATKPEIVSMLKAYEARQATSA